MYEIAIGIDGFLTQKAVQEVREVLSDEDRRMQMVEKNYKIGKRFFSYSVLRKKLSSILSSFYGEI